MYQNLTQHNQWIKKLLIILVKTKLFLNIKYKVNNLRQIQANLTLKMNTIQYTTGKVEEAMDSSLLQSAAALEMIQIDHRTTTTKKQLISGLTANRDM